jgi:hypothetical protein
MIDRSSRSQEIYSKRKSLFLLRIKCVLGFVFVLCCDSLRLLFCYPLYRLPFLKSGLPNCSHFIAFRYLNVFWNSENSRNIFSIFVVTSRLNVILNFENLWICLSIIVVTSTYIYKVCKRCKLFCGPHWCTWLKRIQSRKKVLFFWFKFWSFQLNDSWCHSKNLLLGWQEKIFSANSINGLPMLDWFF